MRCAYRPVPQQHSNKKQQWALRKWVKATMQMVRFCRNSKVVVNELVKEVERKKKKKKKHLKRNAPKSQILIKVYFNCIHRLLYAAYGLNKNSR